MMNWKEIKKKCPKAWNALKEDHNTKEYWGLMDDPDVWWIDGMDLCRYELRHLFDFFDERRIIVIIIRIDLEFYYSIRNISLSQGFSTRSEAEEAAFTKAFEILEEQLNESNLK